MNLIAQEDPVTEGVKCWEYVILTVACQPLANTFVQASGGMSVTAEVLMLACGVYTVCVTHACGFCGKYAVVEWFLSIG